MPREFFLIKKLDINASPEEQKAYNELVERLQQTNEEDSVSKDTKVKDGNPS